GTVGFPDPESVPVVRRTTEMGPPGAGPQAHPPGSAHPPPPSPPLRTRTPPPPPPPRSRTAARAAAGTAPGRAAQSWPPGSRIGQYEIIRELGSGGMGIVFLARDDRLGRRVAIKFLQTGNPELTRRFLIEARATAQCSHENIVVIHEVGEVEGSPYM